MKLASLLVSDYMTENPITVEPEEPLMRALEIIRLRGVRRLPVAVGGMLVGLITEGDIKRAEPSTLTDSQEDFTRVMEGTPISRIMISKPVTTTADTPLMEAAEIMLNTKYGALPVVAGGRVVGILTDNDLTRALVDLMREAKEAAGLSRSGRCREDADVETSSDAYARRFAGAVGGFFLERQSAAVLDLLRPWPGASVLDVGGGHGQVTGPLVEAGYAVTVLGSDPACEARVREWTGAGRARFLAADLLAPGLADRSYDVVLSLRLLPHVRRVPELVATLARLARAAVIVDYPTRRSVNAVAGLLFGLKQGVEGDTRPFTVFADREIEAAFAAHGFSPTGRRPQFFAPMALHRALGSAGARARARGHGVGRSASRGRSAPPSS